MNNPFIELLNKMEHKIRTRNRGIPPDEFLVVIATQLKLLRTLYQSMLEFNMKELISNIRAESYEEREYKYTKSFLDYFQFINILNQLGRIFKECNIVMPKFNRINFFRNKVSEHWEEYTKYGIPHSQYQLQGEAAIPSVCTSFEPEERKKIKYEIDKILQNYGLILDIDNSHIANIADFNVEEIYSILEKIDPTLVAKKERKYIIPDKLVELFFEFGLPAPIKITEYSIELVNFMEKELDIN